MNLKTIGIRLKQLRTQAGLSQDEVAAIIGKERSVYARMERGQSTPTLETLIHLKEVFKISLDWLVTGKGSVYDNSNGFDVFSGPAGELPEKTIEEIQQGIDPDPDVIRVIAADMLHNQKFYSKTLIEYLLVWR